MGYAQKSPVLAQMFSFYNNDILMLHLETQIKQVLKKCILYRISELNSLENESTSIVAAELYLER